jgi:three-Cys-motif partner protein
MEKSEWLKKYVTKLVDLGSTFGGEGADLAFGPHTVAKDLSVYYYAEMFAKIARGPKAKARGHDGAVYLDLFAGPGIISVGKHNDLIAGSPLAATRTAFPFDYSVFVEISPSRADLLEKRLASCLADAKYTVKRGNSNDLVSAIIKDVKDRFRSPIVLAFIDPEGMEAKWETARQLSTAFPNIDFMINVTTGAARVAGRIEGGMTADIPIFNDFFGPNAADILVKLNQGEKVGPQYEANVKSVLGRTEGATIDICGQRGRVVYHLLGYTRNSWTGAPWADGFRTLKAYLDGIDDDALASVLDVVKGRQNSLSDFS